MCVPWKARTGQVLSRIHSRVDLEDLGYKCEATLSVFPPHAPCPAVLSLSVDHLSCSSSPLQSGVLSSLSLSETHKGSTPMMVPASNIKDAKRVKYLDRKKDHIQTSIRDLMLLNLKNLLGSPGRWKVLDGIRVFGSGLWTSTT